jgi:hypothetical protein
MAGCTLGEAAHRRDTGPQDGLRRQLSVCFKILWQELLAGITSRSIPDQIINLNARSGLDGLPFLGACAFFTALAKALA